MPCAQRRMSLGEIGSLSSLPPSGTPIQRSTSVVSNCSLAIDPPPALPVLTDRQTGAASYHMSLPDAELTVGGWIRARAARDPGRVFIVKDAVQLDFGEADRRSRRIARGLLAAGAGKGTR